MSIIQPHAEQQEAIALATTGQSFKIIAFAGSGKTTTLDMVSKALPHKRGLYLAFNKAIAQEASNRFDKNVDCRTFHSLAFRGVDRHITQKLGSPRLSPNKLAEHYQLKPMTIRRKLDGRYERFLLSPATQANLISNAVSFFCATSSQYPAPRHIQCPEWMHEEDATSVQHTLYPFVEKRWLESISPHHSGGISHDIYLKVWALSEPRIHADYILFDEAQDSDPIMLGILLAQKDTQVIYAGDPHQQIYGWRGAINAMQQLPIRATRLTQSFRFGSAIADIANVLLNELGEQSTLKGTAHIQSHVYLKSQLKNIDAILCRTNARAMELLVSGTKQGHRVALQADSERLKRFVQAAARLKAGQNTSDVPELAWFNSWQDVHDYCETSEGSDLKTLVKLVEEHGTERLEGVLSKTYKPQDADYVISTAHKAKGLEWDTVVIEDDFNYKLSRGEVHISAEELRLLYVATTRAKLHLELKGIQDLIKALRQEAKA